MTERTLPLIGITCAGVDRLPRYPDLYIGAVRRAGGEAVYISPDENLPGLLVRFDGFIIPGGMDLDPIYYNEAPSSRTKLEDPGRTDFEISLIREIIRSEKPLLGICYGMQLINVFFKGTLYQDIDVQISDNVQHSEGVHMVRVDKNPYISKGEFEVNTSHHQAVRKAGGGLKTFAFSSDGITEAFYLEGQGFVMGVQWHPERLRDILSERIFGSFIGASHAG